MYFTVEEENLICMYHNADRRRTIGRITAALPDMDEGMQTLAQQTGGQHPGIVQDQAGTHDGCRL